MKKIKTGSYLIFAIGILNLGNTNLQAQENKDFRTFQKEIVEAKKTGNTKLADSLAQVYMEQYLFKLRDKALFTKDNLTFMSQNLKDTESKAFKLFLKDPEKVNVVLGKDRAQYALRDAISKNYFQGVDPIKKPNFDWTILKKTLRSKFGEIGLETMYSKQMIYYLEGKDWDRFGKCYVLYFNIALKRPEFNINDVTWELFENVNDIEVLSFACDVVMKYAMEEWYQADFNAFDTYANLLYKIGRREQAIEWEERAVRLSNQGEIFVKTLTKMKNNQATWAGDTAKP